MPASPPPSLGFAALPDLKRPLLDKFYRQHRSAMRLPAGAQGWVARDQDIIAGLSLTAIEGGQWLTGLLVALPWRRQGVAGRLIDSALASIEQPVWLFCDPQLLGIYQAMDFIPADTLPISLQGRLERYRRHKSLIALQRQK
jgi:hypothetical protein